MALTEVDKVNLNTVKEFFEEEKGYKTNNSQIFRELLAEKALLVRKLKGQY